MQKVFEIVVDIQKKILTPVFEVNTNDLKSVKLLITITNGSRLLDLTENTVRIAIRKPDNNIIFQDCVIRDATKGLVEIVLENQAYLIPGTHTSEIMCYKGQEVVAVTGTFSYRAINGIMNDLAVQSKSEFTTITGMLKNVQDTIDNLREEGTGIDAQARADIEKTTALLAEKATKADISTLDTKIKSQASGSPKEVFVTKAALDAKFPTGNTNIYVVSADGNWYYWNGTEWSAGGLYQSAGIADELLNKFTVRDFTVNSTKWVLTAEENKSNTLILTNAREANAIETPALEGKKFTVINSSGFPMRIRVVGAATTTGVRIEPGEIKNVVQYNNNYFLETIKLKDIPVASSSLNSTNLDGALTEIINKSDTSKVGLAVTYDYKGGSENWTLTKSEELAGTLIVKNSNDNSSILTSAMEGKKFTVINQTNFAVRIRVLGEASTSGVRIEKGETKHVIQFNKNYVLQDISSIAGSSEYYVPVIQEAVDGSKTLNANTMKAVDLISLYDNLMSVNAGYITKSELGKDATGIHSIYKYVFSVPKPEFTIVIGANMHGPGPGGDPRHVGISVFNLMKQITLNSSSHDKLDYLRKNARIVVLPIENPWGFDNNSRYNSNGVDINRNFSYNWENYDGTAHPRGSSPFSEPETRYIRDVLIAEKPIAYIDYHAWMNNPASHNFISISFSTDIFDSIANNLGEYFAKKYNEPKKIEDYSLYGNAPMGTAYAHYTLGMYSCNPEYGVYHKPANADSSENMTKMLEWYANFLFQMLERMSIKPNRELSKIRIITQAEYDSLNTEVKNNDNVLYYIV